MQRDEKTTEEKLQITREYMARGIAMLERMDQVYAEFGETDIIRIVLHRMAERMAKSVYGKGDDAQILRWIDEGCQFQAGELKDMIIMELNMMKAKKS